MGKIILKEWIDERINSRDIDYFDYDEFSNIEDLYRTSVKKANWEDRKITVVLKVLNNSIITDKDLDEFIIKLKALRMVYFHPNINRFFGVTKDSDENYLSVLGYVNKENLRCYLKNKFSELQWNDKVRMALDISQGLTCLHSKKIIHGYLHAYNILVHNDRLKIAGFGLFEQVTESTSEFKNIVYVEPQYLRNSIYKRDMRSDIYSLGILLWELTSGRPPFSDCGHNLAQIKKQLLNGLRENQIENTPLEYVQLYQKCWHDDPNLRPEINEVFKILFQLSSQFDINEQRIRLTYDKSISDNIMELDYKKNSDQSSHTAKTITEIFGSSLSEQQIIRQFKLNHGLILTGDNIRTSEQAIIAENGELKIDVYKGQPLVYTYINSEGNDDGPSDICINFPVAEMIYNGKLLEQFSNYMDVDVGLHELYDHFVARKFLLGNQLFIKDFNLVTTAQIDILKFYLFYVYRLTKCSTEIQSDDLFTLNLLPKIVTLDGKQLDAHEKFVKWMDELHQKKLVYITSYENLIPFSQLKSSTIDKSETLNDRQPGVVNFKEKLSLEEWLGNAMHNNLMSWARDFQLFRGLRVNKNYKIENSKKSVCNFIKVPEINLIDKVYLDIIKPTTKLEQKLISNNIFSLKSLSSFPFIKSNDKSCEGYNHVLVKYKKYEILFDKGNIKPTEEFELIIDAALNNMKPLKALQDIFNEYGHLFPQSIVLGKSLKNVTPNLSSSNTNAVVTNAAVNNVNEILESLDNMKISHLLTQKGEVTEKNDLTNWIKDTNDNLEIIEFKNIIPLYKILKYEQHVKIENILRNNYSVIMTGITDLKDLNNNNVEHYKRINLNISLESEEYEVFGSIISKNNSKLEEFYVNFALYDFNGFYAIINKSNETNINITNCNVFWMIIGKPSKLSVFSPKNRDVLVKYFKESITLQPEQLDYHIKISSLLLQNEIISFNASFKGVGLKNTVKLIKWTRDSIDIKIDGGNTSLKNIETISNIDLNICIIFSYFENLKIDNTKEECPLYLIGDTLKYDITGLVEALHIQDQEETPLRRDMYSRRMINRRRLQRRIRHEYSPLYTLNVFRQLPIQNTINSIKLSTFFLSI
ncbi:hypothetical protein RclHR1_27170001 [Rhizophagus clarus]|uniref:Protein kinase domain-containing protein n=1 Tax=Rhizophagus clarus TaxID=94130 RepID=A0A2Z6RHA0_9GLOM|nr:hypothetical protein RclHR1_27170001 [Rhizophagus clarus]